MKARAGKRGPQAIPTLGVFLSLLLGSSFVPPSTADATEPSLPIEAADENAEVRGLVVFRVSEAFLRSQLEREIERYSPVDRTIEGTRGRGTARTTAKVTVELAPQEDAIAFHIIARGTVDTNTVGRNGSAILRSNLWTPFAARVPVLFDGVEFERESVLLNSDSRLHISCVGSVLPGLRGRLVTRVASRRAAERRSRVEAIAGGLTERAIRSSLEESVNEAVEKLNRRLQTRRLLSFVMRTAKGRWLRYSSSTDALRIAWYPLLNSSDVPRCPLERSGDAAVQLWIHDRLASALGIDRLPKITDTVESCLQMILPTASLMENIPLPSVLPLPPIRLERLEEWYVVKIQPA